jgi:hypothetical protein
MAQTEVRHDGAHYNSLFGKWKQLFSLLPLLVAADFHHLPVANWDG